MKSMATRGVLSFAALLVTSCVIHTNAEWIRDAAARDLKCPKGQLHVTHYSNDPDKKGVEGCGHRVTYVKRCSEGTCSWVRDPNASPPKPKDG